MQKTNNRPLYNWETRREVKWKGSSLLSRHQKPPCLLELPCLVTVTLPKAIKCQGTSISVGSPLCNKWGSFPFILFIKHTLGCSPLLAACCFISFHLPWPKKRTRITAQEGADYTATESYFKIFEWFSGAFVILTPVNYF